MLTAMTVTDRHGRRRPSVSRRLRRSWTERVLPNESAIERQDDDGEALLAQLQDEVRDAGSGRRTCRPKRAAPAPASSTTRI